MKILNYEFTNPALFERAVTHSSKSKLNYERMEFLGDSILDFITGEYLYKNSSMDEGKLTPLRAHYVSEPYLSKIFDELGLEKYVKLGKSLKGELSQAIKADMVEAVIAGIYLDSEDLKTTSDFVINILHIENFEEVQDDNYKSQLQELLQANFKCSMKYLTEKVSDSTFEAKFFMDDDMIAKGYGKSKQSAEQNCAYVALNKLFNMD